MGASSRHLALYKDDHMNIQHEYICGWWWMNTSKSVGLSWHSSRLTKEGREEIQNACMNDMIIIFVIVM